jgi:hypothetical protein
MNDHVNATMAGILNNVMPKEQRASSCTGQSRCSATHYANAREWLVENRHKFRTVKVCSYRLWREVYGPSSWTGEEAAKVVESWDRQNARPHGGREKGLHENKTR